MGDRSNPGAGGILQARLVGVGAPHWGEAALQMVLQAGPEVAAGEEIRADLGR